MFHSSVAYKSKNWLLCKPQLCVLRPMIEQRSPAASGWFERWKPWSLDGICHVFFGRTIDGPPKWEVSVVFEVITKINDTIVRKWVYNTKYHVYINPFDNFQQLKLSDLHGTTVEWLMKHIYNWGPLGMIKTWSYPLHLSKQSVSFGGKITKLNGWFSNQPR